MLGAVMVLALYSLMGFQIADTDKTDNRNQEIRFEAICPTEPINATVGGYAIVPLRLINLIRTPVSAKNMEIQIMSAERNQVVHHYKEGTDSSTQDPHFKGRTFVRTDRIHEGYLELFILPVELLNNGNYTCYVRSKAFHSECGFHINVSEPLSQNNLCCIVATCVMLLTLLVLVVLVIYVYKLKRKLREAAVPNQEGKQLLTKHEMDPLNQKLQNQKKMSGQQHGIVPFSEVDVLLNISNTSSKLWVSEDRKSVKLNETPDGSKPCDNTLADSFVLGCEGFTQGKHCWEVDVGLAESWAVGIALESVSEECPGCLAPDEGVWCVGLTAGQYRAFTTPVTFLNLRDNPKKLRVYLDVDEGQLYFYDSDTRRHIYSHMWRYTEKVLPFIWTMDPNNIITVSSSSRK